MAAHTLVHTYQTFLRVPNLSATCFLPGPWVIHRFVCHLAHQSTMHIFKILYSKREKGRGNHSFSYLLFLSNFHVRIWECLFPTQAQTFLLFSQLNFESRQNLKVPGITLETGGDESPVDEAQDPSSRLHQNSSLFICSLGWASL